ncbi:helix-turn-helix domain-containing protein [Nocardiopsis lambiniae]|uniref:XRE family transcriptional regulator n=1 Tax=Nocardiopsis lambiniae TaxID=3075539 RepID=A0ABU2MH71_9ACTN|nr:XRE family transcriptional regulator [Nocardiopsis sp. DSM 44743]MDT0331933.1 XRE family transcriptional regulator [Nocardiopsis sp. DSM 44743]
MDDELAPVLASVGPRLRELRRERGVTLTLLSEATGISVSTLSRLESGGRRPTLELLLPLAKVHGVPLDELVGARTGDPRVRTPPFTRDGVEYLPLSRNPGGIQAFRITIPPPKGYVEAEQRSHEGHDWVYVLEGRLRLLLGPHDMVLTAGEVAEFDTRIPHGFFNPGPGPVSYLGLFGPQGERAHVRVRPTESSRKRGENEREPEGR